MIPLTRLLGRDRELAELASLLAREDARLVTLLGPGGIGKTRLSHALLERCAATDPRGLFCDLSAARTGDEVLHALGVVVGVASPTATVAEIAARLSETPTWLVLDNAEQVAADAAKTASELLRGAPSLRCVVTSRERLRVDGEITFGVSALAEDDAIALFVTRAEAAGAAGPFDRERVRRLVDRIDRIPLAIELAAGQTSVLSLEELEERLGEGLEGLRGVRRDAPDRHRTMRATLEWSWALLDDDGRHAAAALSVFESAFPLSGAERVLGAPDALDAVRALSDRSWLQRVARDGASRFVMLKTVRELARERLAEHPERHAIGARYAAWVVDEADRTTARLTDARELTSAAELTDDLRAIAERGAPGQLSLRAAVAFGRLAVHRGPVRVAMGLIESARGTPGESAELAWHADHVRARLLLRDGRADDAHAALAACLTGSVAPALRAEALATRAAIDRRRGDLDRAEEAYRDALEIAEGRDHPSARARMLGELGALVYERGDLDEAERLHRRALDAHRDAGSRLHEAVVRSNLGLILRERGRFDEAERCFEEALAAHREVNHDRFVGIALADLAGLYFERGALASARRHAEDAAEALRAAGDRTELALTLALLGGAHAAAGDLGSAEAPLDDADARLADIQDEAYTAAARAYRGHLHLARALRATARGAREDAEAELDRARACLSSAAEGHDEARHASRVLAAAIERAESLDRALLVSTDASWIRGPGGDGAELGRRKILCALLDAFVARRQTSPGEALTTEELVAIGWPDERMIERAGANRVRVSLSELRKLGLGDVLRRDPHGYFLDPDVPLVVVPLD